MLFFSSCVWPVVGISDDYDFYCCCCCCCSSSCLYLNAVFFFSSFFVSFFVYIHIEIKNGKHAHIVTLHRPYEVAAAANNSDYFIHYTYTRAHTLTHSTITEANTLSAHYQMLISEYSFGFSPVLVITFIVSMLQQQCCCCRCCCCYCIELRREFLCETE